MTHYPTNPNFTIQKIAREINSKIDRGEDAYEALLKEAKKNNLTPEVVTSAVHYINNEIYLDHYKKASKGVPKTIKVADVLKALNPEPATNIKTASADNWNNQDVNDLSIFTKPRTYLEKIASDESDKRDYHTLRLARKKMNQENNRAKVIEKNASYELNQTLTKTAMEIAEAKSQLLKETVLSLTRNESSPEEIYVLAKTATDEDVSETFYKALEKSKKNPKKDEAIKLAEKFDQVNITDPIIKWANLIIDGKDRLCRFDEKFNSLEKAKMRREGMHKLMDATFGELY